MRAVILAGVFLLALQTPAIAVDPDAAWYGVEVLPKLDAILKVGNETINYTEDESFLPWIVQDVDGEWLWVGKQKKGWVRRSQVVTLDEAPAYYTQFTKQYEYEAWAFGMRAIAYYKNGDLISAISDYGEVIRLNPTAGTYSNRGLARLNNKDYDKAIADYNQAIRLDPNFAVAYSNRGCVWCRKKDYDKAIADFDQAIRVNPNSVAAYSNRGWAWSWKKAYEKALADYAEAIRLDPNNGWPVNNAAWLRATAVDARFRNGREAVELAKKACELVGWNVANMPGIVVSHSLSRVRTQLRQRSESPITLLAVPPLRLPPMPPPPG